MWLSHVTWSHDHKLTKSHFPHNHFLRSLKSCDLAYIIFTHTSPWTIYIMLAQYLIKQVPGLSPGSGTGFQTLSHDSSPRRWVRRTSYRVLLLLRLLRLLGHLGVPTPRVQGHEDVIQRDRITLAVIRLASRPCRSMEHAALINSYHRRFLQYYT